MSAPGGRVKGNSYDFEVNTAVAAAAKNFQNTLQAVAAGDDMNEEGIIADDTKTWVLVSLEPQVYRQGLKRYIFQHNLYFPDKSKTETSFSFIWSSLPSCDYCCNVFAVLLFHILATLVSDHGRVQNRMTCFVGNGVGH